jgi:phage shock protein PspC (stress-responsive transcriptional regulator)
LLVYERPDHDAEFRPRLAVRIGLVALTFFALGPVAILAYLIVGWAAN